MSPGHWPCTPLAPYSQPHCSELPLSFSLLTIPCGDLVSPGGYPHHHPHSFGLLFHLTISSAETCGCTLLFGESHLLGGVKGVFSWAAIFEALLGGRGMDKLTLRPWLLSPCLSVSAHFSCPLALSLAVETDAVACEEKAAAVRCSPVYFHSPMGLGWYGWTLWVSAAHLPLLCRPSELVGM